MVCRFLPVVHLLCRIITFGIINHDIFVLMLRAKSALLAYPLVYIKCTVDFARLSFFTQSYFPYMFLYWM